MKFFDSELRYLSEVYERLAREFLALDKTTGGDNPKVLAEMILRNRELLSRIEQLNPRVAQLAKEWERLRPHLDIQSKRETMQIADAVLRQARDLQRFIALNTARLEAYRGKLELELAEVGKGSRYLDCVKPIKNNYPKFIDSVG